MTPPCSNGRKHHKWTTEFLENRFGRSQISHTTQRCLFCDIRRKWGLYASKYWYERVVVASPITTAREEL